MANVATGTALRAIGAPPGACADDVCGVCISVRDWAGPDAKGLLEHLVRARVEDALRARGVGLAEPRTVPVGVSARHVHLSPLHVEALLGPGARLEPARWLLQPGEFATAHTVSVVAPGGAVIERVRILGPERPRTQLELSRTDAVSLRMNIPMRNSGDLDGTPQVTLAGPAGVVQTDGVIRASRHIHCSPQEAASFGVANGDMVAVRIPGPEGVTFPSVLVRTHPGHKLIVHLDTDDANAAGVNCVTHGVVLT
jgi:propanediol utilization protein